MLHKIRCLFGNHKFQVISGTVHKLVMTTTGATLSTYQCPEPGREDTHVRIYASQCKFCRKQKPITEGQLAYARYGAREWGFDTFATQE